MQVVEELTSRFLRCQQPATYQPVSLDSGEASPETSRQLFASASCVCRIAEANTLCSIRHHPHPCCRSMSITNPHELPTISTSSLQPTARATTQTLVNSNSPARRQFHYLSCQSVFFSRIPLSASSHGLVSPKNARQNPWSTHKRPPSFPPSQRHRNTSEDPDYLLYM